MKRRTLIASIGAVAGTTLGAAAYSSATVTRDATIGVETDQNAHIQLTPGQFSQITQDANTGELLINFTKLNANSTFVFGDTAGPAAEHAFSLSHLESTGDIGLAYGITSDPNSGTINVQFDVYTDDGTNVSKITTADDEGVEGSITGATSADTYYVVLTLDTAGVDSSTADLSGTLSITA